MRRCKIRHMPDQTPGLCESPTCEADVGVCRVDHCESEITVLDVKAAQAAHDGVGSGLGVALVQANKAPEKLLLLAVHHSMQQQH